MADSKISQLNSADKIYDNDLMVVVTGYDTEGSYPDNCKISLNRIRQDIIRLNEMIFFLSGFSGYYNSGENTYTITSHHRMGNLIELDYDDVTPHMQIISTTGINLRTENLLVRDHENTWPYSGIVYTTGLNAVVGNNIEIQFSSRTPASDTYGRTEGKYKSGIISTTGLNSRTENLIVRDFESTWPYSGIIYNTGLNAVVGNNIEIQFLSDTPASNIYGKTEGKYKSGIISTTGLNVITQNLIVRDFQRTWPYSGIIYNTGLNAVIGNNIEIQFSPGTPAANRYGNVGGKYKSGIISVTGLNARAENLIVRNFETTWPYSGIIYHTGLNARAGNNIEIDFSTSRHPHMGTPYYSGTISTTGLNMIASTGIQYSISNTWPHPYVVSQLDSRVVANRSFSHGPITINETVLDSGLYKDIDWSLSNSKPLIDDASLYCYMVEFFINGFTLSNIPVPSPDSKGRPTTAIPPNNYPISWGVCNTTITPATVTIGMNGNNIINTNPSSNPVYNISMNDIYLRYIEKRNLNSDIIVQPRYTIEPASYTRSCSGTYQVWVPVPDNPSYPEGGYYYTQTINWDDDGILDTTLSLGLYRHLKLEFAELNSTPPPPTTTTAPTTSTTAAPTTSTTAAPTTSTTAAPTTSTTAAPTIFPAGANTANFNNCADWDGFNGNITSVGTNGGPSAYGTFDQIGNVYEWNDLVGTVSSSRGFRGGNWDRPSALLLSSSSADGNNITNNNGLPYRPNFIGFRVASSYTNLNAFVNLSNTSDFVIVNDANNSADTGGSVGKGSVGYNYAIGKYPITYGQYAAFLQSIAGQEDTYGVYNANMSSANRGGIEKFDDGIYGYYYGWKGDYYNKPVVYVSWFDCARYCNWLHNGQPIGNQDSTTTEDGAYTLNGVTTGNAIAKNPGAKYYIPTENEWYKAAYYKGGGTNAGYWSYATQSNSDPTCVNANSVGDGI